MKRHLMGLILPFLFYCLSSSQTESATIPSTFFRVTAPVTLKNGESIDIDVVVECRWTVRNIPGSAPLNVPVRIPYMYGVRTKDGHGVLLHTPDACGSDVINRIPKNFFPLVLWSDDANDLESLTAYTSEAGYEHSSAKLKLNGTQVRPATKEEHLAWIATAPKNIVPSTDDPFDTDSGTQKGRSIERADGQDPRATAYFAVGCYGYLRYPIPKSEQQKLRRMWPTERPRFWIPSGWVQNNLTETVSKVQLSPPAQFVQAVKDASYGLLRHDGSGSLFSQSEIYGMRQGKPRLSSEAMPLDTYPIEASFSYAQKRKGGVRLEHEWVRVPLKKDGPKGQMSCSRWPSDRGPSSIRKIDGSNATVNFSIDIGGEVIESKSGPTNSGPGLIIIEEDKYWIGTVGLFFGSETGGLN
jgi:hypothetical protein